MDRVAAAFDAAAPTYDTIVPFFATFATSLVSVAEVAPGERVLDVACGRGAVLRAAQARGASAVGIDLSAGMVAALGDDARVGDAEALDWPDGSFDVVTCGFGVFFFPSPGVALAEAHRVLRPGGRFAATVFANGMGGFPWTFQLLPEHARAGRVPSPVRLADGLVVALDEAGFVSPSVTRVEASFRFDDVDHYLAWLRSHAGRMSLEVLSDAELAAYRSAAAERLDADDRTLVQGVDVVVARRP